jgi:PadR family transcriptional regulator PadR
MSRQAIRLFGLLVAAPEAWMYGYQLCEAAGLKSGTLYPLLIRLADHGYLEARWEDSIAGRPRRHLYRLTSAGLALARARIAGSAPRAAPRAAVA